MSYGKLADLCAINGYDDPLDMLEDYAMDSVCPAICMNEGCDYTLELEQDQDRGWCDECETNSMKSGMVLAGVM